MCMFMYHGKKVPKRKEKSEVSVISLNRLFRVGKERERERKKERNSHFHFFEHLLLLPPPLTSLSILLSLSRVLSASSHWKMVSSFKINSQMQHPTHYNGFVQSVMIPWKRIEKDQPRPSLQ